MTRISLCLLLVLAVSPLGAETREPEPIPLPAWCDLDVVVEDTPLSGSHGRIRFFRENDCLEPGMVSSRQSEHRLDLDGTAVRLSLTIDGVPYESAILDDVLLFDRPSPGLHEGRLLMEYSGCTVERSFDVRSMAPVVWIAPCSPDVDEAAHLLRRRLEELFPGISVHVGFDEIVAQELRFDEHLIIELALPGCTTSFCSTQMAGFIEVDNGHLLTVNGRTFGRGGGMVAYCSDDVMLINASSLAALERAVLEFDGRETSRYFIDDCAHTAIILSSDDHQEAIDRFIDECGGTAEPLLITGNVDPGVAAEGTSIVTIGQAHRYGVLRWPIDPDAADWNALTECFGPRRWKDSTGTWRYGRHYGVDIAAAWRSEVHPVLGGEVVRICRTGCGVRHLGRYVLIDHGNGLRSVYGHLSKVLTRVGRKVEPGDVVGLVGSTGGSKGLNGVHLHLGFYTGPDMSRDHAVNPLCFFDVESLGLTPKRGYGRSNNCLWRDVGTRCQCPEE